MSNRSKKHHYLPRYYLKGFTDEVGKFFVYDKAEDRVFQTNPATDSTAKLPPIPFESCHLFR